MDRLLTNTRGQALDFRFTVELRFLPIVALMILNFYYKIIR